MQLNDRAVFLDKSRAGGYSEDVDTKARDIMTTARLRRGHLFIGVLAIALLAAAPACKQAKQVSAALDFEEPVFEVPEEPAEAPPVAPPPKISEPVYIEIKARIALIWEKFKDDPAEAEKAVEAVYEKFNVVHAEFQEYEQRLTPAKTAELQGKIQEFIQKIASEYR
jgi:hypothetical protein